MNRKPRSIRRTITTAVAAVLVSTVLPAAPIAANAQSEDRGPEPRSAPGTDPAVYVLDGRVVAIRRDPVPPGAYGGQGVDYSPDMSAWILGPHCGQ